MNSLVETHQSIKYFHLLIYPTFGHGRLIYRGDLSECVESPVCVCRLFSPEGVLTQLHLMQAPSYNQGTSFPPNMQLGAYGAFMQMCNPYAALQSDPMMAW